MNKIFYVLFIGMSLSLNAQVAMYRGTSFCVPHRCKHLAILGSTPHPTQFLAQSGTMDDLRKIRLADFLDIEYLHDSFKNTLKLCMHNNIDHLLIAYLPGHFVAQRAAYALPVYERSMNSFLERIGPQIAAMIRTVAHEIGCEIPVTLVLPPRKVLKTVPIAFSSNEHRIQHYIRSFPRLKGLTVRPFQISIINNCGSDEQNEGIMRYLSYEYVLQTPLNFSVLELKKEKFHNYISRHTMCLSNTCNC